MKRGAVNVIDGMLLVATPRRGSLPNRGLLVRASKLRVVVQVWYHRVDSSAAHKSNALIKLEQSIKQIPKIQGSK
jgi:hypothetical protein